VTDTITEVCKLPREAFWASSTSHAADWTWPARRKSSAAFESWAAAPLHRGPLWHPTGKIFWYGATCRATTCGAGREGRSPPSQAVQHVQRLTYDRQGRLLACEHATSQVTRTETDGRIVPIASIIKQALNSPNDIVCKSDGGIYFSDPPYGRAKFTGGTQAGAGLPRRVRVRARLRRPLSCSWTLRIGPTACASRWTSAPCSSRQPRASTSASSRDAEGTLTMAACGRRTKATSPAPPMA